MPHAFSRQDINWLCTLDGAMNGRRSVPIRPAVRTKGRPALISSYSIRFLAPVQLVTYFRGSLLLVNANPFLRLGESFFRDRGKILVKPESGNKMKTEWKE